MNGKFSLLACRAGKSVFKASAVRLEPFDGVYPDKGRAQDRPSKPVGSSSNQVNGGFFGSVLS